MSARTRASSPGGTPQYALFLTTGIPGINIASLYTGGNNADSFANAYFASPIVIPFPVTIQKIGFLMGDNAISGSVKFGVHRSLNFLPDVRVCETAAIAFAQLPTTSNWKYFTPTTTPLVPAGLYYVGWICDAGYVAATSGIRLRAVRMTSDAVNPVWSDNLIAARYNEVVGALNVPDPMIPVFDNSRDILAMVLRVTV